jgi:molybdopterin synthase sulfur carrier subunit
MAIKVLYFAGLREAIGSGGESVAPPANVSTVAALRDWLAVQGAGREALKSAKNLRAAVNQKMAGLEAAIADGDEVAFFPPVTGG